MVQENTFGSSNFLLRKTCRSNQSHSNVRTNTLVMNCHNRISLYSSFTHKCLPFLICGTFISSLSVPVLTDHSFLTGTNQTDPVSSVIRTEPIKSSYSTVSPYPSPNSISVHPYPRQLIQYYSNASPLLWKVGSGGSSVYNEKKKN